MTLLRVDFRYERQVLRKLKQLEPRLRKQALTRAIRAAMRPVLTQARAKAPKGETGTLRRSIKMRAMKRNRRGIVGIHVASAERDYAGQAYYGSFQEFGWHTGRRANKLRVRGKWSGIGTAADTRRMIEGKHFIEKAFEDNKEQAYRTFKEQLPAEIHRIVTGG